MVMNEGEGFTGFYLKLDEESMKNINFEIPDPW
jgi:hypothetical protein